MFSQVYSNLVNVVVVLNLVCRMIQLCIRRIRVLNLAMCIRQYQVYYAHTKFSTHMLLISTDASRPHTTGDSATVIRVVRYTIRYRRGRQAGQLSVQAAAMTTTLMTLMVSTFLVDGACERAACKTLDAGAKAAATHAGDAGVEDGDDAIIAGTPPRDDIIIA